MLGKIEGRRRRWWQRRRWLDSITNSMDNEFEQTLGDTGGQGSLAYAVLWGLKKSDRTECLNNNDKGMKNSWVCLWSRSHCPNKEGHIPGDLTPIQVPTSRINLCHPDTTPKSLQRSLLWPHFPCLSNILYTRVQNSQSARRDPLNPEFLL